MKSASLIALTALLSTLDVATAAWQKIPSSDNIPVNLASGAIVGTKVVSVSDISNSQALLAEDPTQLAGIPAGSSSAVIDISDQSVVDFVSLINEGCIGTLSVSASTNKSDWVELSKQPLDTATRLVEVKFAGIQAKYVKLSFALSKSGSLSSVKVIGTSKSSDYRAAVVKAEGKGASNALTGSSGSKPVYMYPTPSSYGELDIAQGSYKFPKTNERFRTIIYDLGDTQTLRKFSAAYSKVPTRVEVFTFEVLPEKKDWRGKMTFDPAVLETMQPVAVGEDANGIGRISVNSAKPVTAKYAVMRFEPNYNKKVTGLGFEWQSMVSSALIPFSGIAQQTGLLDVSSVWQPVASEAAGEFVVLNLAMSPGGSNVKVHISKSAIAKVQQQMGPGTTELQAINAILKAAGLEPVGGVQPGNSAASNTSNDGGPTGEEVADPVMSNALSGFGLSAYRNGGSGGIGGGSGSSSSGSGNNNSSNNGSSGPIVIITETVNPTTP